MIVFAAIALLGAAATGVFAAPLDSGKGTGSGYVWQLPAGFLTSVFWRAIGEFPFPWGEFGLQFI